MKISRSEIFVLGGILLFCILLRAPGVHYGLPVFEGADDEYILYESVKIASGERMAAKFGLPDSTLFYSYGAILAVAFEGAKLMNATEAPTITRAYVQLREAWIHETIRVVNILWSLAGLLLLYTLARRLFSRHVAMLAIVFMSVSYLLLEHTVHVRPDIPSIVFVFGTLHLALNVMQHHRTRDYLLAGVGLGLSVATKYPLILLAIPIIIAHIAALQEKKNLSWKHAILSKHLWSLAGISLVTFSIATPLFWPNLSSAIEQLQYEARSAHSGADSLNFFGNVWFYITHILNYGIGTFVSLLALCGIGWMFVRKRMTAMFLVSFPLATLLALSFHGLHWDRWMIPVLPFIALFAAYTFVRIFRQPSKGWRIVGVIILFFALVPAVIRSAQTSASWLYSETREVAREWFLDNAMDESIVVRAAYTPRIPPNSIKEELTAIIGVKNVAYFESRSADYIIISGKQRERFFNSTETPDKFKVRYQEVLAHSSLIFRTEVPQDQSFDERIRTSDWNVWRTLPTLDVLNGEPMEIYAFSERAKEFHANK